MISTATVRGKLLQSIEEVRGAAPGSWRIYWRDDVHSSERKFPEHVKGIYILMPVKYCEAYPSDDLDPDFRDQFVEVLWQVPRWTLTGTPEAPTLHPSLFWRGVNGAEDVWHGWLEAGLLRSC